MPQANGNTMGLHSTIKPLTNGGHRFLLSDIHGYWDKAEKALLKAGYNSERGDKIICIGDLIDGGNDSGFCLELIKNDNRFITSLLGNHEYFLLNSASPDIFSKWMMNGGSWILEPNELDKLEYYRSIVSSFPVAITIETAKGKLGLVHGSVPKQFKSWGDYVKAIDNRQNLDKLVFDSCWSRHAYYLEEHFLDDIQCVIVGHNTVKELTWRGSYLFIDTGNKSEAGNASAIDIDEVFA